MTQEIHHPKVSVLLPNLNYRKFLKERIRVILDQTLTDWELVIVDSYSDDGAWELIQEFAAQDSRIQITQAPREGIYAGLNRCIQLARGEYIYIATSDDTMSADCLEKMTRAMDAHPDCDICHTCLEVIDEQGNEVPNLWNDSLPVQFYGTLLAKPHIRVAPYDGILYCALQTVFISLTQLLIRRSVFKKVGLFRTDWNSASDFEWGMRATLVCNVLHIPETIATWRIHAEQATANVDFTSSTIWAQLCRMIKAALPILKQYHPEYYKKIRPQRLLLPYRRHQFWNELKECYGRMQKICFLVAFMRFSPRVVGEFLLARILGKQFNMDNLSFIREELQRLGIAQHIKVLD